MRRLALGIAALALAVALRPAASDAHDGPPYPILVDQMAGPFRLSAWADPDVGTGTFLLSLEPAGAVPPPADCAIEVVVRPADGHLPETRHRAEPGRVRKNTRTFQARVPFDQTGPWDVRIELESSAGRGQAGTRVEVTPPGQGPILDFILYLFPFVAVAFLFVMAALRKRRPATGDPVARPGD